MTFAWTPEAVDALREMAAAGKSGTQIGAELGTTRGAVLGKAKRIGVKLDGALGPRAPRTASRAAIPDEPWTDGPTIGELKPHHCRFPMWTGRFVAATSRFCGQAKVDGRSWCAAHVPRVFSAAMEGAQ